MDAKEVKTALSTLKRRYLRNTFQTNQNCRKKIFFCNNANSAIDRKIWLQYKFDEELSGLEDMDLSKEICS